MRWALGLLLLLPLAACSGEADIPTIESEIEAGIKGQLNERVTVDCPDQVEWTAGGDFHCFAEDRFGQSVRVTVSMQNADGEWSWVLG